MTFNMRLLCVLVSLNVCQICSKQLTSWSSHSREVNGSSTGQGISYALWIANDNLGFLQCQLLICIQGHIIPLYNFAFSFLNICCIFILLSVLPLPGGLFSSFFPPKFCITFSSLQQALHALTEQIK